MRSEPTIHTPPQGDPTDPPDTAAGQADVLTAGAATTGPPVSGRPASARMEPPAGVLAGVPRFTPGTGGPR